MDIDTFKKSMKTSINEIATQSLQQQAIHHRCTHRCNFSSSKLSTESSSGLKTLHDIVSESDRSLQSLGIATLTWDAILVHIIANKSDRESRRPPVGTFCFTQKVAHIYSNIIIYRSSLIIVGNASCIDRFWFGITLYHTAWCSPFGFG